MAYELITIDNINFKWYEEEHDSVWGAKSLGLQTMVLPEPMVKTIKRDLQLDAILPHYYEEDLNEGKVLLNDVSGHACYNADTQIVFMHHFFNKRRKYELKYFGEDVFWLFHDSRHAVNDVMYSAVRNLNSHIEIERLHQGLELALKHGRSMKGSTLFDLQAAWNERWLRTEGSSMHKFETWEFYKYLTDYEKYMFDSMNEWGHDKETAYSLTEYEFEQGVHLIDE